MLITGGRGKVGRRAAEALVDRGHHVLLADIVPARHGPAIAGDLPYYHGDLTDFGVTVGVIAKARPDVIVHAAGIPGPSHDAPAVVFRTNATSTFNVAEAAVRLGITRLVYVSSETTIGYVTAERPARPDYLPVDELHALRPQEAYSMSKAFGEMICDATVRRADITAVSIRPSLVLDADDYQHVLSRFQATDVAAKFNLWSYVDARDLGALIALAAESDTPGHEVVYAAAADNITGRPLKQLAASGWPSGDSPELRPTELDDASGIDCSKAQRLFGWRHERSWRQYSQG